VDRGGEKAKQNQTKKPDQPNVVGRENFPLPPFSPPQSSTVLGANDQTLSTSDAIGGESKE